MPVVVAAVLVAGAIALGYRMNVRPEPGSSASQPSTANDAPAPHSAPAIKASPFRFTQIAAGESGIDFVYYGSPSDEHYMIEQNGGGIALFDADLDGWLDVFLVNGSHWKRPATESTTHRLYRQNEPWRFDDVSNSSGLGVPEFGQGCAAADYDNDGFVDLLVTTYHGQRLWHNRGDGTFTEVTEAAGVTDPGWSTSAAFADLDADGDLDLYVVKYVDWTPGSPSQKRIPSPMDYRGLPDHLYRNEGTGGFTECGHQSGIAIPNTGKGLALGIADLDGDDRLDIYVANDTTQNFLFRNHGELRFEEIGVTSGCAVSQDGGIGSSMGVAISDYNSDGRPDLFVTNFAGEYKDVFTNRGPFEFIADSTTVGIEPRCKPLLNFGVIVSDFELDGRPDLFFANGHLWDDTAVGGEYRMRPTLLRNAEGNVFIDAALGAGSYFDQRWLGRGVAAGDIDNDGDTDLVVTHLLDPPALLRNDSPRQGSALRLQLQGTCAARQPLGIRVDVVANGRTLTTHVPAGESFQSSHDDRLLVPIGTADRADVVRVRWGPDHEQTWTGLAVGGLHQLRERCGEAK